MALDIPGVLATELSLPLAGVKTTIALLAEGATIPFLARYRKEQTGNLDEVVLAAIQERLGYYQELEARKETVLGSIREQGKLTPELERMIVGTRSKTELEDLYLPFKPKRRTKAMIARERGLEPLADLLWSQPATLAGSRDDAARAYVDVAKEVPDVEAAWQGARDIVAERVAEQPEVRAVLRDHALSTGFMASREAPIPKTPGPDVVTDPVERRKYQDYFDFRGDARTLPSHRVLALRRGEKEGVLRVVLDVDRDHALGLVRARVVRGKSAVGRDLDTAIDDAYDRLVRPSIEVDVRLTLKERAEAEAIRVFADNLRHLLMAAPLGGKRVLALDPGFRTGCKLVVLDATGRLLADDVIYPHEPQRQLDASRRRVIALCKEHQIEAIAIGNGTAGRETETFARALRTEGLLPDGCLVVSVNESGASVYSASEVAREELPDKDITVRGSVSIGRRLQDPLSELVKVDPKAIGVGQYQHDVNQPALKRSLDLVVASCVNQVGVEVNTASPRLLAYVAGIGETVAKNIVEHRSTQGPFRSRKDLLKVPRLGAKAFEQAAGFLRVRGGDDPLDGSAVHPESYDVVARMAKDLGVAVAALIGQKALLARLDLAKYQDERRGELTLKDIVAELEKPGRDPRASFEEVGFAEGVTELSHLKEGMVIPGVVTNVTAFGAFVDVGVHQDGLCHVSELANRFVKDPAEVVKVGDRVRVKVLKVEADRKRISLSIKQTQAPTQGQGQGGPPSQQGPRGPSHGPGQGPRGPGQGPRGPSQGPQGPTAGPPRSPFNQIRIRSS